MDIQQSLSLSNDSALRFFSPYLMGAKDIMAVSKLFKWTGPSSQSKSSQIKMTLERNLANETRANWLKLKFNPIITHLTSLLNRTVTIILTHTHVVMLRGESFTSAQLNLDKGNEFPWMGSRLQYIHHHVAVSGFRLSASSLAKGWW